MKQIVRFSLVILIFTAAQAAFAYTSQDCINCHKIGSSESTLQISIDEFKSSVHGEEATCQECHTLVEDEATKPTWIRVRWTAAAAMSRKIPMAGDQKRVRHPNVIPAIPGMECWQRTIRSSVHPQRLKETCRSCHPRECGQTDYFSWLPSLQVASHSKQDFSQEYSTTDCLGCHQGSAAHGEQEPINDQTCFTCHLTPDGKINCWDIFTARRMSAISRGLWRPPPFTR